LPSLKELFRSGWMHSSTRCSTSKKQSSLFCQLVLLHNTALDSHFHESTTKMFCTGNVCRNTGEARRCGVGSTELCTIYDLASQQLKDDPEFQTAAVKTHPVLISRMHKSDQHTVLAALDAQQAAACSIYLSR
jgi:hypothetical protein